MVEVVRAENYGFRYSESKKWAVRNFDLTVGSGEIVVLAGPSGCGKSTLLRSVNGLIPHMYVGQTEGSVMVDGRPVADTPMSDLAQKVGLLFQNPENQIFMFSVERDVAFGLENLGVPREEMRKRVDEAMRLMGITELAARAPHELSDGQKQRVALAGVVAMNPRLIILDEPTSLLDPRTALELVELLERLRKENGTTLVVVEHRLDLLVTVADRIVVMSDGTKVLDGTPRDVLFGDQAEGYGISVPAIARAQRLLAREGRAPADRLLSAKELADVLGGAGT
ncbi:MAG TPA: ATP-binding cassette domain-containing protein [Nitrososphaerales archaeon]|nr:ATP-binding cassette domain-containing protein [Nitrososphaerales archaeon]